MTGFVYFIRPKGMLGPVKIGYSWCPKQRLYELAAWSPFPLEIVFSIEAKPELERKLHRRFYESHLHREWFSPTADVVRAVQALEAGLPFEGVIDLSIQGKWLPRKTRHFDDRRRQFMSYVTRIRFAVRKADIAVGGKEQLRGPRWALDLVGRLDRWPPSAEDLARLDALIADPVGKCPHVNDLFPRREAA
jgi:hypothetical protein